MANFSDEIINEILAAPGRSEIEQVILRSAKLYEQKTSARLVLDYFTNMVRDLQGLGEKGLSTQARENIAIAIQIFRDLYRQKHDNLY